MPFRTPAPFLPSVVRNILSIGVGDIAGKLITLGAFIYIARLLSPAVFGDLNFAMAIAGLFVPLVDFGLGFVGTRAVARDHATLLPTAAHIILLRTALAVIAFALLVLVLFAFGVPDRPFHLALIFGLVLFLQALSLSWAYQGTAHTSWFAVEKLTQAVLYAGLVLLFFTGDTDVFSLPLFTFLSTFVAVVIILFGYLVPNVTGPMVIGIGHFVRRHWAAIFPLFLTTLITQFHLVIDIVIVWYLLSSEQAGEFSAGFRLVITLLILPNLLWSSFFPILSRSSGNEGFWRNNAGILMSLVWWSAFFTAGVAIVYAEDLFGLVYGDKYEHVSWIFRWLLMALALSFPSLALTRILPTRGFDRHLYKISAIAIVTHIAVSSVLTWQYGIMGAAMGFLVSEAVMLTFGFAVTGRLLGRTMFRRFAAALTAGTAAFGFGSVMQVVGGLSWEFGIFVTTLIYGCWFMVTERRILADLREYEKGQEG